MSGSLPTFARTEITLVRAGLFKLGDFETGQLGIPSTVIEHGGKEYVYAVHPDFRLPDAGERRRLDASDWRVLMAVTSLAAVNGNPLEPGQVVPEAPDLWNNLGCQADAEGQPARYLVTNAAEILRTPQALQVVAHAKEVSHPDS
jgi:hypothetical protein